MNSGQNGQSVTLPLVKIIIHHGGFLVCFIDPSWWTRGAISHFNQCSTNGIKRLWCVLYCLWDGVYKRSLAADRKE